MSEQPNISIILPVYNEEHNLPILLDSLCAQDYPLDRVEVLVADGGSTDGTSSVLKTYQDRLNIRRIDNPRRDCHFGKKIAIQSATNDLLVFLDADNEIAAPNWLSSNIWNLLETEKKRDPVIVESCYLPSPADSRLCNHLMSNLYIGDPLSFYFAPKPVLIEQRKSAVVLQMAPGWPTGANGFFVRKSLMSRFPPPNEWFAESDYFASVAAQTPLYILRVNGTGVHHHYVQGWVSYFRKRLKIGRKFFTRKALGDAGSWIENSGRGKASLWALYLGTFILPFVESMIRAVKDRNPLWLVHAPAGFLSVLAYLTAFIQIRILKRKAF